MYSEGNSFESVVTYECHNGFRLQGTQHQTTLQIECLETGLWNSYPGDCESMQFQSFCQPSVVNCFCQILKNRLRVLVYDEFLSLLRLYHSVVMLTSCFCYTTVITCSPLGVWSNVHVNTSDTLLQTYVRAECDNNYRFDASAYLEGSVIVAYCDVSAQWVPTIPNCIGQSSVNKNVEFLCFIPICNATQYRQILALCFTCNASCLQLLTVRMTLFARPPRPRMRPPSPPSSSSSCWPSQSVSSSSTSLHTSTPPDTTWLETSVICCPSSRTHWFVFVTVEISRNHIFIQLYKINL